MSKQRKRAREQAAQVRRPPEEIDDRGGLLAALRAAGVPDGENYDIPGFVRIAAAIGPYLFLVERDGHWLIGTRERGSEMIHGSYPTEGEASRAFFDRVVAERWAARHPVRRDPDAPRLSRRELVAETERLRREAERINAEREKGISEQ